MKISYRIPVLCGILKVVLHNRPLNFFRKANFLVIVCSPIFPKRRYQLSYQDRDLTCVECNQSFVFTADDQQYHADKGYTNEPKRCPSCRQARRSNSGGGGSGFRSGPREMHPAVCAQCGKDTEVPFLPRGDRPVYCSDCFSQQPSSSSGGSYR